VVDNLKDKKVLVVDTGVFTFVAERLARDFGKVFYWVPNYSSFPDVKKSMIGEGLSGITVIDQMFYKCPDKGYDFNEVDLFVFPDVYMGDLQEHLISLGKRVWGSRDGEKLELLRIETREQVFKKIGLPVSEAEYFTNFDDVVDHIKNGNSDLYLKVSWWRGLFETHHIESHKKSEDFLLKVASDLGVARKLDGKVDYILESPIKSKVECGVDAFVVDGEYASQMGMGFEIKDKAYITTHVSYDKLHESMKESMDKLKPVFSDYGYRGWFATEVRMGEDGNNYLIDCTCRCGSPNSEIQCEWVENLAEIIWYGSKGIVTEPKYRSKYAMQVAVFTNSSELVWNPIYFEDETIRKIVKLKMRCRVNGLDYVIPGTGPTDPVGFMIVLGDTVEECISKIKENSGLVKGYCVGSNIDSVDEILEVVENVRKNGIEF